MKQWHEPVTFSAVPRYGYNMNRSGEFYRTHKEKLFNYLMRMTGDYHLSSDLVQESFTRFYAHYRDRMQSPSLLYTIARHALVDHLRRRRKERDLDEDIPQNSPDQEQELIVRQEYRRVLAAMQQLGEEDRHILSLVLDGSFSYRDIAGMTGTSEGNIKVKVHRARTAMKKLLKAGER